MSSPHPNVTRLLAGMAAFNANDIEAVKATFHPDLVYRVMGRSALAGEYRGLEAYGRVVQLVRELSGGTALLAPEITLADDQTVMIVARQTAQRQGKEYAGRNVYFFRFNAAGQCIEGNTIPVDQYAFDAFWI